MVTAPLYTILRKGNQPIYPLKDKQKMKSGTQQYENLIKP